MATSVEERKETSREEDFRDYEERDLDEGWPYPDADSSGAKRNEAYGRAPAGLENDGNAGAEIADSPAIRSQGGPMLSQGIAREAIDDDGLEEEIYNQLSARDGIDADQITVTVHDAIAELTGSVERAETGLRAEQVAASVPGIVAVRNRLRAIGIDANIPSDASE